MTDLLPAAVRRIARLVDVATDLRVLARVAEAIPGRVTARHGVDVVAAALVWVVDRRVAEYDHDSARLAAAANASEEQLVAAETEVICALGRTADPDDVTGLLRQVVAVHEILAAQADEPRGSVHLPDRLLFACAPELSTNILAGRPVGRFDRAELLATLRRLEDDIRFARMGTTLYRCYAELADEDADRDPTDAAPPSS